MSLFQTILSLIFPSSCLSCGESGEYLCSRCLHGLPLAEEPEEDFIYSVFNYRDGLVKKAVWTLKYAGRHSIAPILAKAMSDKIAEELSELAMMENFTEPALIPIPISARRFKERGFNQAEILAAELAGSNPQLKLEKNVLYKIRETKNQARIHDRNERLKNLKGAFEIKNPGLIKGRNIILIDDVSTTGATLVEAKRILEKSGAKKVIALTLAH
jgi:competence protein ComFC